MEKCRKCEVHDKYDEKYDEILKEPGAKDGGIKRLLHCSAKKKAQKKKS